MQLFLHYILYGKKFIGKPLYSVSLNLNHEKSKTTTEIWRLKRWWYLSKRLTITISCLILVTFSAVQLNWRRIWNWNLSRNLIIPLLIMATCTVLFEKLYTILRWKEPRRQDRSNFSFKMFKLMRSLRASKCLKTSKQSKRL